ncbi:hypothetical protein GF336_01300 [Candidatus Woesearchaeota archaeon]|nr:hypothetical protein [Candidatus Woesearchaeota archaeon]
MKLTYILIAVLFAGIVFAQPQIPIQVYGDIDKSISDGSEITFEDEGVVLGSGEINDNKYGYDPVIFIEGYENGEIVEIKIEGVKVAEQTLEGSNNEIDIEVSDVEYNHINPPSRSSSSGGGGGSGGGRGSSTNVPECFHRWECNEWGDCIDGIETRICSDTGTCTPEPDRTEEKECSGIEDVTTIQENEIVQEDTTVDPGTERPASIEIVEEKSYFWAYVLFTVIVVAIVGGLGFAVYEKEKGSMAEPKIDVQRFNMLQRYIKTMSARGYNKEQIRQALLNAGWEQDTVDPMLMRWK